MEQLFEHASGFEQGEVTGNVRVGKFEAAYEQLFAEVIEDGVITAEERTRLDQAADSLGLDRARLLKLEIALTAAYEAKNRVTIRDLSDEPVRSLQPLEPATDPRTIGLQKRIAFLEARVRELEADLEEARSHVAVEVDFSDVGQDDGDDRDPNEIHKRVRHDPRDVGQLRALYQATKRLGELDRARGAAEALVYLGEANDEEKASLGDSTAGALIKPTSSVTADAWRRLLTHPDQELLVGEIFSVVVSAVLLGRVAALRHAKQLPALDPARRADPKTSTIQAVRCFGWAASILGMESAPLYADPTFEGAVAMVPGVPPSSRLGKLALSGRSPSELAFLAGRHLAWYREDHFVRLLVPTIPDLEDVFLGALTIGNPGLPLSGDVKRRVAPIAAAIQPILEPLQIDRLRGGFLRFVEEGGRTNLQRWATAADLTSTRAGYLMCGDLATSEKMLALDKTVNAKDHLDDLIVFATSDRYAKLKKQLGLALV